MAAIEKALGLIENTPTESGGKPAPGSVAQQPNTGIRFEQVRVSYPGASQPALDGVDLEIHAGETIALVGASGSGKTTLVNLLPRFIEISSGRISVNGVALQDWDLVQLRSQFALVSQHVVLLNESIAANVALGDEAPDEARVMRSLVAANLDSLIDSLPSGIHTIVGHNATQLSGGQRQRLAIARALYKNAPILILDEATSALDTQSERAVQEALERLMKGRTSIVIAHRLSTVQHADRILVMEAGKIVEAGQHAELLARKGLYAKLHQMGLRKT